MPLLNDERGDRLVPHDPESPQIKSRFTLPLIVIALAFAVLVIRLWSLQIIKGREYEYTSQMNRIRTVVSPAPRGMILDRHGKILADNVPSYSAYLYLEDVSELPDTLDRVEKTLGIEDVEVRRKVGEARGARFFAPILLKDDISWEELAKLEVQKFSLPGVKVEWRPRRSYVNGAMTAHLIGYVGEIDEKKLKEFKKKVTGYRLGDFIGKAGIEEKMETYLKGLDGAVLKKVDAFGREIEVVDQEQAYPGKNVYLSIDADLQRTAETLLNGKTGSIMAMNPRTGEILAMVNSPSFDPSIFSKGISPVLWQKLVSDPSHPLENKALRGVYPPGSTFKVITLAAAFELGLVTPETTFTCPGGLRVGRRVFRCWRRGGHGTVDLRKAIVQSCDVYFYRLGRMVGINTLAEYARKFGLGKVTGIGIGNEKSGLVPTSEWKLGQTATPWVEGDTVLAAVGQGYVLLTPVQLLEVYSAIANGGKLMRPLPVKKIEYTDGKMVEEFGPDVLGVVNVRKETLDFLRDALAGVVNDEGGTGAGARLPDVEVAGKTGTAQVVRSKAYEGLKDSEIPEDMKDHAWFASFAPSQNPEIAVVVLIEHGGMGGRVAAPVAREVIRKYFELKNTSIQIQAPGGPDGNGGAGEETGDNDAD